jgi:GT2 family glycosyltransferase
LDEDFFMYYEDIEWAYRMKKAGWDRFYIPAVRIIHDMGATWRALPAKRQLYRSYEGKYLYFAKRYGYVAGRLVRTITLVCARQNVILASVLVSLRIGGEHWKRKLQFNRFLLDAHAQTNRMDDGIDGKIR